MLGIRPPSSNDAIRIAPVAGGDAAELGRRVARRAHTHTPGMPAPSTTITLAMLHFVQPTPAPSRPARWCVWPEGRLLSHPQFCEALDAVPKPVLIGAHVEQGGVTVTPLAAAAEAARPRLEHEWRNQVQLLRAQLAALGAGAGPVPLLLALEDEDLLLTTADLTAWAESYAITSCGWTVGPSDGDARAPLRLGLLRADGTFSPGWGPRRRPGRFLA
jgi:hypothetical protein